MSGTEHFAMGTPGAAADMKIPDSNPSSLEISPPGLPGEDVAADNQDAQAKQLEDLQKILKNLVTSMETMEDKLKKADKKNEALEWELSSVKRELMGREPRRDAEDSETGRALKPISHKNVDKPEKYNGDLDGWLKWSKVFKKFLKRQDERWVDLLEAVENLKGRPVTVEDEATWVKDLKLGDSMNLYKEQLNDYLETYTKGVAKSLVEACGDAKALDAWRQMADKGHSLRQQHQNVLRRKAYFPKTISNLKEVERYIALWETDVDLFVSATKEHFPEENRKMLIVDMCPDALRKHLKERTNPTHSYEHIKIEISDWLADPDNKGKTGRVAALEQNPEERNHEDDDDFWDIDIDDIEDGELRALVKNKFGKRVPPRGPAANNSPNKKDEGQPMDVDAHKDKDCYNCGEVGHISANCPQKLLNGGGKGGKGGKVKKGDIKGNGKGNGQWPQWTPSKGQWSPSKGQWKSWFPGPTQTQWTNWFPGKGGKGNGKSNGKNMFFTGQGHQLFPVQDPSQWLFGPGTAMTLTEKRKGEAKSTPPCNPPRALRLKESQEPWVSRLTSLPAKLRGKDVVQHRNTFAALNDDTDDAEDEMIPLSKAEEFPKMPKSGEWTTVSKKKPKFGDEHMQSKLCNNYNQRNDCNASKQCKSCNNKKHAYHNHNQHNNHNTNTQSKPRNSKMHANKQHPNATTLVVNARQSMTLKGSQSPSTSKSPSSTSLSPSLLHTIGMKGCEELIDKAFCDGDTAEDDEYERLCEAEDAEIAEMLRALPDRSVIMAEEDKRRRAKIIPVEKPPGQFGSCWAFTEAPNGPMAQGVAQVDSRRIGSAHSWVAGGSAVPESRGGKAEEEWSLMAASLPENCSLLVQNFLNGDVDEMLQQAMDNDVRKGAAPMQTSLAHRIWALPGPREPAVPAPRPPAVSKTKERKQRTEPTTPEADGKLSITRSGVNPTSRRAVSLLDEIVNNIKFPAKDGVRPLTEIRPQALRPAGMKTGEWEYVEAIVDSGATVTVFPPKVGSGYAIMEGEAARAGVVYEVANGQEIPNLGEKQLPIMTIEGSVRGLKTQIADVSKPLQAVRSLIKSGHLVVFGDGDDGTESYVVNKFTGEVNMLIDDGVNYLMGMYVVPPEESGFTRQVQSP